jgi:hypothetical protein
LIWSAAAGKRARRNNHRQRTGTQHRNDSHDPILSFWNSSTYCSTCSLKSCPRWPKKYDNESAIYV